MFARKPHLFGMVLLTAFAGLAACDRSNPQPPTTPTPSPAPVIVPPSLVGVAITGSVSLVAVGETSPMTAMASFSDGTSRNVTGDVQWSSSDTSVITVSTSGVLTVVRFGTSSIVSRYQSKSAQKAVTATPPGTFVVSGRVREPGTGDVENVRVLEMASGMSTVSLSGRYSLGGLTAARLSFEKEGFERATIDATRNGFDDVPLQRILRIAGGDTLTTTLAPNDMDYRGVPNTPCYPCRLIRVSAAAAGALQMRLAWTEPHSALNIWVDGRSLAATSPGLREVVAEVPVAAGELLVYVGLTGPSVYYVPLTLTTVAVK